MKLRYKLSGMFAITVMTLLSSCIDDSSNYGGMPVPELKVITNEPDPDKLPIVNFNYGEDCVIDPKINYNGTGKLEYEWSVGTLNNGVKGELEYVGSEPVLNYFFHQGGSYYAHLKVTDGVVGAVQDYQVNINRSFEQGYLIVSNDANNIGNLAFIKDITPEDKEAGITSLVMEHCLERVNENFTPENIAGATMMRLSWPSSITRILVSCGSKSMFIDPNTFISIATIDHQSVIPGFKADMLVGGSNALAYDSKMRRFITLRGEDMLGIVSSEERGTFDTFFYGTYYAWGTQYYHNFFVNRSPLNVFHMGYGGQINCNELVDNNGTPIFENQELVSVFMGETEEVYDEYYDYWYDIYPTHIITRDLTDGKYYHVKLSGFSPNDSEILFYSRIEIPCTSLTAIPATEGPTAVSETYHRTYYSNGNNVYVLLVNETGIALPSTSQAALSFPADEEVTFMTINTSNDDLLVATANKNTGRGNVYIYESANVRTDMPGAKAKAEYKDCADRISNIFYKPRVAN